MLLATRDKIECDGMEIALNDCGVNLFGYQASVDLLVSGLSFTTLVFHFDHIDDHV